MKKRIILTLTALSAGCLVAGAQTPTPAAAPQSDTTEAARTVDDLATPQAEGQNSRKSAQAALALDDEQSLRALIANSQEQAAVQAENASQDAFRAVKLFDEGRSRGRAVLVTTTRTNAESLTALDDDLRVMAHILDKTVAGAGSKEQTQMLGIFVTAQPGGRAPQSLYLEGDGAVFIRSVKMALLPGLANVVSDKTLAKKDSAWEEAKQEIDGPKRWNKAGSVAFADPKGTAPYDAEKVEVLKANIIGSLKNAANIRGLADNETVTVVLQGAPESRVLASAYDPTGGPLTLSVETLSRDGSGRAPTMIIRVKKADAEAAQNGAIDTAEFRKRATVTVY